MPFTDQYGVESADGECVIVVTESEVVVDPDKEAVQMWHWTRLNRHGTNIDGSGRLRNGEKDLAKLKRMLKKRFPEDRVEGLGG